MDTVHECDRQTDGRTETDKQTDKITITKTVQRIASHGKNSSFMIYKKLSYCWETVRRESIPSIAEMDVEITI